MKKTFAFLAALLLAALVLPAQDIAFPSMSDGKDSIAQAARIAAGEARADQLRTYLSSTYPGEVKCVRVTDRKVKIRGRRPAGRCSLVEVTPWEDVDPQHLDGASVRLCLRHTLPADVRLRIDSDGDYHMDE